MRALDNIEKMKQVPLIGTIYLLTNYRDLAEEAGLLGVKVLKNRLSEKQFHFGKIFADLINREHLSNVFIWAVPVSPLVTIQELKEFAMLVEFWNYNLCQ